MKKDKIKVYIYTRVSTTIQVDGYSLDAQKARMKAFAEYNDYKIVGEYEDAGKSGKSIEGRLEFNRMMEDIKSGKDGVSYVLVFKLSRFGRNAADVLSTLQVMQDFGVNLICVEDGIDSSKDAGKLMISVLSAVAEIERENIRVQTMEGRIQKAREGKWNGGFAPYGYTLEKGKLYVNEEEAEAIRIIFDKYVHTDMGANGLARYLANHGIGKIQRQNGKNPLFDADRQAGDTTVIEDTANNAYYVVYFKDRYLDHIKTVDVRQILISADTSSSDAAETDETETTAAGETETAETESAEAQEQAKEDAKAAAKIKAEQILDDWKNGDATEDSFAELAKTYSDDTGSNTNGGLYEAVKKGQMVTNFNDWIFDASRKPGDTGIVESDYGYHIIYFVGDNKEEWYVNIKDTITSNKLNDYMSDLTADIEVKDSRHHVAYLHETEAATETASETDTAAATESAAETAASETETVAETTTETAETTAK